MSTKSSLFNGMTKLSERETCRVKFTLHALKSGTQGHIRYANGKVAAAAGGMCPPELVNSEIANIWSEGGRQVFYLPSKTFLAARGSQAEVRLVDGSSRLDPTLKEKRESMTHLASAPVTVFRPKAGWEGVQWTMTAYSIPKSDWVSIENFPFGRRVRGTREQCPH